jgi:hypothetical protein
MLEHRALLYKTGEDLAGTAGAFLKEGLERSEPALAVTTKANIELLRDHLGPDAGAIDFREMSSKHTPAAILDVFTQFLREKLEAGAPWVRILGEPRWTGRSESEVRLWTRHESLMNLVFAGSPMTLVCPYDARSVAAEVVLQARHTHPETIEAGELATSPDYTDPGRFVL